MQCHTQDIKRLNIKDKVEIALDDLDFSWTHKEIRLAINLWNDGTTLQDMAEQLRPNNLQNGIAETFLLLMHLDRKGRIGQRPGYIWGVGENG